MDLKNQKKDVYAKIGLHLMLYQTVEELLKYLIVNEKFSSYINKIRATQEESHSSVKNKTFGQLVDNYLNNGDIDNKDFGPKFDSSNIVHLSISLEFPLGYYEKRKLILKGLLSERNNLVHHSLINFDMNSIENCEQIKTQLDKQEQKIREEIKALKISFNAISLARKEMLDFITSTEFISEFLSSNLSSTPLVLSLLKFSTEKFNQDGWTSLSEAGKYVREKNPEEISILKKKYGHDSLKALILETEIFDLYEKPTKNSGKNILYRVKKNQD